MARINKVGHVVLNVKDVETSVEFYTEALGMEVMRLREGNAAFLSFGAQHHDIALFKAPEGAEMGKLGLNHIAFQIEDKIANPDFNKVDPNDRTRVLKHFPPGPQNPLGERWMQITHGEGWTLGIHGTPQPELLGQAVSGGCIRMRNADVIRVYDAVELGTPVIVRD